ncbi:HIT domain-containing protein [Stella sp.]|uniref:HIT domain-containing protein n=1 Tax=Stella sp. TaxID=2912054 RepID=UPI0035B0AE4D
MFTLDSRLADDTFHVTRLGLCDVRLMDEPAWPWLILVPALPGIRELTDLGRADRARLVEEIALAERVLTRLHRPDKLNVAALGNMVPQLHVHVIARRTDDPAWPRPVWGAVARGRYPDDAASREVERLAAAFADPAFADG